MTLRRVFQPFIIRLMLLAAVMLTPACAVIEAMDPPSVRAAWRVLDGVEVPDAYRVLEGRGLDKNSPYRDYEVTAPSEVPTIQPPEGFVEVDAATYNGSDGETLVNQAWEGEDAELGVTCWVFLQTPNPSSGDEVSADPLAQNAFRISTRCSDDRD